MIDVSTYLLVDIICAVLLGNLITKIDSNIGSEYETRAFKRVILATMLLVTADAFWTLGENGVIHFGRTANGLTNAVYMALTGVISYLWLAFFSNCKLYCTGSNIVVEICGFMCYIAHDQGFHENVGSIRQVYCALRSPYRYHLIFLASLTNVC